MKTWPKASLLEQVVEHQPLENDDNYSLPYHRGWGWIIIPLGIIPLPIPEAKRRSSHRWDQELDRGLMLEGLLRSQSLTARKQDGVKSRRKNLVISPLHKATTEVCKSQPGQVVSSTAAASTAMAPSTMTTFPVTLTVMEIAATIWYCRAQIRCATENIV
jgi:hypothetical protein